MRFAGDLNGAEFGTFEDYCRDRWGISKTQANRLISAHEVVGNLAPIGVIPVTESQARPLTRLESSDQIAAWQQAVETAPNGKVTAALFAIVIGQLRRPTWPAGVRGLEALKTLAGYHPSLTPPLAQAASAAILVYSLARYT